MCFELNFACLALVSRMNLIPGSFSYLQPLSRSPHVIFSLISLFPSEHGPAGHCGALRAMQGQAELSGAAVQVAPCTKGSQSWRQWELKPSLLCLLCCASWFRVVSAQKTGCPKHCGALWWLRGRSRHSCFGKQLIISVIQGLPRVHGHTKDLQSLHRRGESNVNNGEALNLVSH